MYYISNETYSKFWQGDTWCENKEEAKQFQDKENAVYITSFLSKMYLGNIVIKEKM